MSSCLQHDITQTGRGMTLPHSRCHRCYTVFGLNAATKVHPTAFCLFVSILLVLNLFVPQSVVQINSRPHCPKSDSCPSACVNSALSHQDVQTRGVNLHRPHDSITIQPSANAKRFSIYSANGLINDPHNRTWLLVYIPLLFRTSFQ